MWILKQNFDTEILFKEEEIEKLKQEYAILKDE